MAGLEISTPDREKFLGGHIDDTVRGLMVEGGGVGGLLIFFWGGSWLFALPKGV